MSLDTRVQASSLVSFAGIEMRSPIGVAAVGAPLVSPRHLTAERHAEVLLKHIEAGAGYVCVPCMYVPEEMIGEVEVRTRPVEMPPPQTPTMNFLKIEPSGGGDSLFYASLIIVQNMHVRNKRFQEHTAKVISLLRQKKPGDVPIFASVAGIGGLPETLVTGAKKAEEAGVDLVELNLSCAVSTSVEGAVEGFFDGILPAINPGVLIGDRPGLVEETTRKVVDAVAIPVGVKLSPETGFPRIVETARRARDAGAKFVTCSNQAVGLAPPDIYRGGRPRWPYLDSNPFVGASGDWLRVVTYKQIGAVAKYVPGIDIAAAGGLMTPEHAIEAMMLGAKAIQYCSGVLYSGRGLIRRTARFLPQYMKECGYTSVHDFVGLGVPYIRPTNQVKTVGADVFADVDEMKCTGCGICTDNLCLASHMVDGIAHVNAEECSGCGMCIIACASGARSFRQKQ
ncbi:MAG: hypothetical protein HYX92_15605 [Chloroflexi bacterium]|nr:hypothetical protein [Chloroflexota bacterium]